MTSPSRGGSADRDAERVNRTTHKAHGGGSFTREPAAAARDVDGYLLFVTQCIICLWRLINDTTRRINKGRYLYSRCCRTSAADRIRVDLPV